MAVALPVMAMMSVAGTAMSAYGQLQAGQAQKRISEQNARLAEMNAAQSDLATADKISQLRRNNSLVLGAQKAGYAKAGVAREGTVLDMLTETVLMGERDVYRVEEENRLTKQALMFGAAQERYKGSVAQQNSYWGAGSTLLSGWGQTALSYRLGQSGIAANNASALAVANK